MDTHAASAPGEFRFHGYRLDPRGTLWRQLADGSEEPVHLGSRALDILKALVVRQGELVTRQALLDAAWPGLAVEESNLAVQISSLRRVLDEDKAAGSSIQTIVGRGYRFLPAVTVEEAPPALDHGTTAVSAPQTLLPPSGMSTAPEAPGPVVIRRRWSRVSVALAALLIALCLGSGALSAWMIWGGQRTAAPRLSLVVLPFQNLGGDANDDYLIDVVTEDLTAGLSRVPEAFVIAHASARTYKGRAVDARQIGRELGVRYVVGGGARRIGPALRVNVALISTDTGAQVWSDRFDEPIADLSAGQDMILQRMRGTLGISLIQIESARLPQTPATTPDAFDLILRARALRNQQFNRQRYEKALSLYEQALQVDPSSVLAMMGTAYMLLETRKDRHSWFGSANYKRVEALLARAQDIAPTSEDVMAVFAYWQYVSKDCRQSMPAARRLIETYPNPTSGYGLLIECLIVTGHAEEVIPLLLKAVRLNPRDTWVTRRYQVIGSAYLFLNDNYNAIKWLERALAEDPDWTDTSNSGPKRKLAAAYARVGKDLEARRMLAAADKDWPFDTVRGHWPDDLNPTFAAQVRDYQEALRRAGERDHAEEDADYGLAPDAVLRLDLAGYTPLTAPDVTTVRTSELPCLIAERHPIIVDAMTYFWGRSIPGAVALRDAGLGGTVSDDFEVRLGRKMASLTERDLNRPIVAVGWNGERFDGRNLALRLVRLGYTQVYWYRGGREAWEMAGLPEADVTPEDW
jgi:adenylate cyclase